MADIGGAPGDAGRDDFELWGNEFNPWRRLPTDPQELHQYTWDQGMGHLITYGRSVVSNYPEFTGETTFAAGLLHVRQEGLTGETAGINYIRITPYVDRWSRYSGLCRLDGTATPWSGPRAIYRYQQATTQEEKDNAFQEAKGRLDQRMGVSALRLEVFSDSTSQDSVVIYERALRRPNRKVTGALGSASLGRFMRLHDHSVRVKEGECFDGANTYVLSKPSESVGDMNIVGLRGVMRSWRTAAILLSSVDGLAKDHVS